MDHEHVHITVFSQFQGLARPGGHPFQLDSGILCEFRDQVVQKPGIVGAGGGRHHQGTGIVSRCRENRQAENHHQTNASEQNFHTHLSFFRLIFYFTLKIITIDNPSQ